jgi:uncharacterized membrane protein YfcA
MPENALALVLLGIVAGVMSGMFGIGGGVIIVPALTIIMAYQLESALGTSLAVLIWPVAIFAVIAYYRARLINLRGAVLIGLGLVIATLLGAQLALNLPRDILQRLYGLFLVYIGWRFAEPRKWLAEARRQRAASATNSGAPAGDPEPGQAEEQGWPALLGIGLVAGIASGLFGIGGGVIIVPMLVGLLHYDQKRAVGTSLAALLPPVGIGGIITYYQAGYIHIATALTIAAGLVGGAFFGARIALGLPSKTVKRLYGVFLLVISLRFIFQIA